MKLIRKRILLKAFATFFLLEIVTSTVAPAVSWALTAGPTAPEATSFEPVDTSDVVDLRTGDFTYNVPMMEIPGPAGGYPLVLSHHGNVQLGQEASWVGLSWNLNPGAISRLVNGYPDDHNGVNSANRDYWEGGTTETYTVGLSVGKANAVSVTGGLSFSNDTYRGSGIGWYAGIGDRKKGISYEAGETAFGQTYASVGITQVVGGSPGALANASVGVSINTASGLSGKIGISSQSAMTGNVMDMSIQTNFKGNYTPGTSVAGIAGKIQNGRAGHLSSQSDDAMIEIPFGSADLRLGRSYQRYWIDETVNVNTYGSLYGSDATPSQTAAFDTYDLLDKDIGMGYHTDGEYVLGGSFSDVDFYSVTGQGIGGIMRPMFYQRQLYRQDKYSLPQRKIFTTSYELSGVTGTKADFRFAGDFSNRMEYTAPDLTVAGTGLSFSFSGSLKTGRSGSEGYVGGRLVGSRHVEWFTNDYIKNTPPGQRKGFVDVVARGFDRQTAGSLATQIGAFSITNESGVTYHYALPAYSFDEISRSQNTPVQQEKGGLYYNQLSRPEKYAYTWYLTSVTGADFVDRNGDGKANDGDWGYWVRFEYDKYMSDYKWRNPGEGFNPDIDNFDVFSTGKKEIYYLDKIYTQSHVAVFKKSQRFDGRETYDEMAGGFWNSNSWQNTFARPLPLMKLDRVELYDIRDQVNSIKSVAFNYDYSLAPNTPNSFDTQLPTKVLMGKLTLRSVKFLGKSHADVLPPMSFDYKNMPYQRGKYDMWGYYKSDYTDTKNQNLDRFTTPTSAADVDAWSLTNIKTPLGSEIDVSYESDVYKTPTLYKRNVLTVASVDINANHGIRTLVMKFTNPPPNMAANYKQMLSNSKLDFMFRRWLTAKVLCACDGVQNNYLGSYYYTRSLTLSDNNIVSVTNNSVEFTDDSLYDYLYMKVTDTRTDGTYREGECYDNLGSRINPPMWIRYPVFVAGNLSYNPVGDSYGGGTRVREISVSDLGKQMIMSYAYGSGVTTYEPIGMGLIKPDFAGWENSTQVGRQEHNRIRIARGTYNDLVLPNFSKLLTIARELPGPGVMYENVTVKQSVKGLSGETFNFPSYTRYVFDVFKESMVDFDNGPTISEAVSGTYKNNTYSRIDRKKVVLKDYTSRIGNLRKIEVRDQKTNNLLQETRYHFAHDGLPDTYEANKTTYETKLATDYTSQGVLEETAVRARLVLYQKDWKAPYGPTPDAILPADERHLIGVVSKKEYFPAIATGTTVTDFKTGIKTVSTIKAFDFYSGAIVRAGYADGYGNSYESEAAPAYLEYEDMEPIAMGGKNMLVQQRSQYTFKMKANIPSERESFVGGWAQTWSNDVEVLDPTTSTKTKQPTVWRKRSTFSFVGPVTATPNVDGFYDIVNMSLFNAWKTPQSITAGWQKDSEVTLYDAQSHVLETTDVNGQYASQKVSLDQKILLGVALNAKYNQFALTGVEDVKNGRSGGDVLLEDGVVSTAYYHTGGQSVQIDGNKRGLFSSVEVKTDGTPRKMHMSFWVHGPDKQPLSIAYRYVPATGTAPAEQMQAMTLLSERQAGDWYLCEVDVPIPGGLATGGTFQSRIVNTGTTPLFIDDLRVHPTDANVVAYVYNSYGELRFMLDDNNLFTDYRYDNMSRLTATYRESFQRAYGKNGIARVSAYGYNYGQKNVFMQTITASNEGSTGSLRPLGAIQVPQNGDQVFELTDACPTSKLEGVWVDGNPINLGQPTVTLIDGTVIKITGKILTFTNVQLAHSIRAKYTVNSTLGRVECARSDFGGGRYCYEGYWNWTYLNECGEPIDWNTAMSKNWIPADLQHLAIDNCCTLSPAGAGCGCFDTSQND